MKFAVVVFPGSNCDHDAYHALSDVLGSDVEYIWHKDRHLAADFDCVILPGGFSYGDYLRCGAIARFSPIMTEVIHFAEKGGYVLGICNGFQMLTECGLLPGALLRNLNLRFACKDVYLKVINNSTAYTSSLNIGDVLRIPIAHGEGNYFATQDILDMLESEGRIVFRYCDRQGKITGEANPNGSHANIAGITSRQGNVLGMMPHPERACEARLGYGDGRSFFQSIIKYFDKY